MEQEQSFHFDPLRPFLLYGVIFFSLNLVIWLSFLKFHEQYIYIYIVFLIGKLYLHPMSLKRMTKFIAHVYDSLQLFI